MATRDVDVRLNLVSGNKEGATTLKDSAAQADKAAQKVNQLNKEMKAADPNRVAQTAKAYGDVAGQADRAAAAARNVNAATSRAGSPTVPGVPAAPPRPAAPGQGGGIFSQENQELAASIGGTVAALQTMAKITQAAAVSIDALKDSSLTAAQANRKVAESIPILGEFNKAMFQLSDAITGRTEEIRKTQRETQANTAKAQAQLGAFQQTLPINEQIFGINAQQRARAANPPLPFNAPGRDTLEGERDFANFERRRPLEQAKRDAQIQVDAAKQIQADAQNRQEDLAQQAAQRQRDVERAKAALEQLQRDQKTGRDTTPGSSPRGTSFLPKPDTELVFPGFDGSVKAGNVLPGFLFGDKAKQVATATQGSLATSQQLKDELSATAKVDAALKERLRLTQELTATQQQNANAVKAAAEAESKLRQANIALMRDELTQLKEREQRVAGAATSFGGLDASQKFSAVQAAEQLKQHGFESLTAEQRALIAQGGGGEALAFQQRKSALNDPEFKAFQTALGQEFDLKAIQQKQVELQAKVEVSVETDATELSKQLKDALEPILKDLVASFKEIADAQIAAIEIAQGIANLSQ